MIASADLRGHERRCQRIGQQWMDAQGIVHTSPQESPWTWDQLGEYDKAYLQRRAHEISRRDHPRTIHYTGDYNPVEDIEFPERRLELEPVDGRVPTFTLTEQQAYGFLLELYHVRCPHPLQWRTWFRRPNARDRERLPAKVTSLYWCPCCDKEIPHQPTSGLVTMRGGESFTCPRYGCLHTTPMKTNRPDHYMICLLPWGTEWDALIREPPPPTISRFDEHRLRVVDYDHASSIVGLWQLEY